MSFWKSLFGGGDKPAAEAGEPQTIGEENYKGHMIRGLVMANGSEFQLAGLIEKEIGGEKKSYRFVRADRFSSKDDMAAFAITKGRQIIDEQGDGIYRP